MKIIGANIEESAAEIYCKINKSIIRISDQHKNGSVLFKEVKRAPKCKWVPSHDSIYSNSITDKEYSCTEFFITKNNSLAVNLDRFNLASHKNVNYYRLCSYKSDSITVNPTDTNMDITLGNIPKIIVSNSISDLIQHYAWEVSGEDDENKTIINQNTFKTFSEVFGTKIYVYKTNKVPYIPPMYEDSMKNNIRWFLTPTKFKFYRELDRKE